jgi:hypothetical protein
MVQTIRRSLTLCLYPRNTLPNALPLLPPLCPIPPLVTSQRLRERLPKEIVDSLDAQTPVERQFAQTIADNQWRINRIRSIEDGMLGMGHLESAGDFDCPNSEIHAAMTAARAFRDRSRAFVNLSIYEQRLHRTIKKALRQLKELQTERRDRFKADMDDAIRLRKTQQMRGLPFDPTECGFVYASAEIEREERRRHRLHDAEIAEKARFNLAEYKSFYEKEAA